MHAYIHTYIHIIMTSLTGDVSSISGSDSEASDGELSSSQQRCSLFITFTTGPGHQLYMIHRTVLFSAKVSNCYSITLNIAAIVLDFFKSDIGELYLSALLEYFIVIYVRTNSTTILFI